ncbi:hypothetical protein COCVIDRAFT_97923 [Bipolaris victoriae FI3]|uniref:Glycoside hydrolase family 43 protein n=2 Tax=Bipolaris TaxID=33194 RepID=W6XQS7_COCC2|nr:uncharacterized protein COCCADRAFT_110363 [Bipolaris zeicola 26-R-13]XP_014557231.1 hypothetical protein COCVIDRAFT_97923 [Bipolaris victoriae FI3]EUC27968.1 hypothetical protein COCCADRAFT_110363 [Bipolaris zeicola 26-R-13]
MLTFKSLALLSTLPCVVLGGKNRQGSQNFTLYGYSRQFGGNPLVFMDGYAYLVDVDELNVTNPTIVRFTSDSKNEWFASPNTTTSVESPWLNTTFSVPTPQTSDRRVGFINGNSTSGNRITSGFRLFGSLATLVTSDGELESLWTGLDVGRHLYALYWNDTSLGQIPITLTAVAPSNLSD